MADTTTRRALCQTGKQDKIDIVAGADCMLRQRLGMHA